MGRHARRRASRNCSEPAYEVVEQGEKGWSRMTNDMAVVQDAETLAGIRQTALDYMQGWYEGDVERMQRSLHPELVKRGLLHDAQTGAARLSPVNKQQMVEMTRQGGGSADVAAEQRFYETVILDVYGEIASVRAESYEYIDYLHLVRWDGRWMIVNVIWTENRTKR